MTEQLLPCPFCGPPYMSLSVEEDVSSMRDIYYCVRCDDCGTEGPIDEVREKAIAAWNRRAASPVQAGIDPLVAEIEARLDAFISPERGLMEKLIAGYRSQAERIATLETDRDMALKRADAHEKDAAKYRDYAAVKSNQYVAERQHARAAESRLAEAREALAYSAMGLRRIHDALVRPGPKQAVGEMVEHFMTKADATLSRLKPGEKGGV